MVFCPSLHGDQGSYWAATSLGAEALRELKEAGLDQELAELVTLRVLHEQQQRNNDDVPLSRKQVVPELVANLPEGSEHDVLAQIREAKWEAATARKSQEELEKLAGIDGKRRPLLNAPSMWMTP